MTILPSILATQMTAGEHVSFIIVGFLFVVVVLAILAFVTSGIGKIMKRVNELEKKVPELEKAVQKAAAKPAIAAGAAAAPASPFAGHANPEHIPALIAAAVHAVLKGRKHRIVNIRAMDARWATEGRRDILTSHRLR